METETINDDYKQDQDDQITFLIQCELSYNLLESCLHQEISLDDILTFPIDWTILANERRLARMRQKQGLEEMVESNDLLKRRKERYSLITTTNFNSISEQSTSPFPSLSPIQSPFQSTPSPSSSFTRSNRSYSLPSTPSSQSTGGEVKSNLTIDQIGLSFLQHYDALKRGSKTMAELIGTKEKSNSATTAMQPIEQQDRQNIQLRDLAKYIYNQHTLLEQKR